MVLVFHQYTTSASLDESRSPRRAAVAVHWPRVLANYQPKTQLPSVQNSLYDNCPVTPGVVADLSYDPYCCENQKVFW